MRKMPINLRSRYQVCSPPAINCTQVLFTHTALDPNPLTVVKYLGGSLYALVLLIVLTLLLRSLILQKVRSILPPLALACVQTWSLQCTFFSFNIIHMVIRTAYNFTPISSFDAVQALPGVVCPIIVVSTTTVAAIREHF